MPKNHIPNTVCKQCGVAFYKRPAAISAGRGGFCSRVCKSAYQRKDVKSTQIPNTTCEHCGAPFYARPITIANGRSRFCSIKCKGMHKTGNLADRFWSQVDSSGGADACWPFTGTVGENGYGRFKHQGIRYGAHRLAYELTNDPLADGYEACHSCDNPPCCNPGHLFPGTQRDNILDAVEKERNPHGTLHGNAKLNDEAVVLIRNASGSVTSADLARTFNVSRSCIKAARSGRTWKHVR